jgi:hypothetical protein
LPFVPKTIKRAAAGWHPRVIIRAHDTAERCVLKLDTSRIQCARVRLSVIKEGMAKAPAPIGRQQHGLTTIKHLSGTTAVRLKRGDEVICVTSQRRGSRGADHGVIIVGTYNDRIR